MNKSQKILAWIGGIIVLWYLSSPEPVENDEVSSLVEQNIEIETELQNSTSEDFIQKSIQKIDQPINKENNNTTVVDNVPAVVEKINSSPIRNTTDQCNENYSGCLKKNAGDYDCRWWSGNGPNYTGMVRVLWYDEFWLDRDNDGWGCE